MIGSGQRSKGKRKGGGAETIIGGAGTKERPNRELRGTADWDSCCWRSFFALFADSSTRKKPSHNGERRGRGRQSLLFTVCCRYLWSKESFVSLVGGCAADCLFANIAVARIAFLPFCRFPSLFILPLPSPLCLRPFCSSLARHACCTLSSSLFHPRMVVGRGPLLTPSCTCRKGKTSFGPGSKRASPLYRRFPPPIPSLISED